MAERSVNTMPARVDVEAARKLCDEATPGPWNTADCVSPRIMLYQQPTKRPTGYDDALYLGHVYCDVAGKGRANLAFIAAARTLLPACLDRIAELEAELARVAPVVEAAECWYVEPEGMDAEAARALVESVRVYRGDPTDEELKLLMESNHGE